MPPRTHDKGEAIALAIYRRGRRNALRAVKEATDRLDALHARDAAAIKRGLSRVLLLRGVSAKQVERIVDGVFSASRPRRIKIIEQAIIQGAKEARGLDEETFRALLGDPEEAPAPFARAQSDSPRRKTPLRLLPRASESDSTETD